jgi:hypothetical protein
VVNYARKYAAARREYTIVRKILPEIQSDPQAAAAFRPAHCEPAFAVRGSCPVRLS